MIPIPLRVYVYGALVIGAVVAAWAWGEKREREGRIEVQAEWDADKAARSAEALKTLADYRAKEQGWQDKLQEAQREREADRVRHARIAAGLRADTDSVREHVLAANRGPATEDTIAACRERASAQGRVLERALQTSEVCAGRAEDVAGDFRLVYSSWPD